MEGGRNSEVMHETELRIRDDYQKFAKKGEKARSSLSLSDSLQNVRMRIPV